MPLIQLTETNLTLDKAQAAHADWKRKLLKAVDGAEVLDVASIRRDDCCDLGKWLHSTGKVHYGHIPEFQTLIDKHRDFHDITGIVAGIINARNTETAKSMLGGSSQFSYASMEVLVAINALKKAIA